MTVRRDTGPVRLPALPPVNAQDPSLRDWMSAVAERLETREGTRGNRFERAVTLRELEDATKSLTGLAVSKIPAAGEVLIDLGGGLTASIAIDNFVAELKSTRLYTDLLRRLDDPNRFNDLAVEIRSILLKSIADEAAARGADIRRTETLIQDSNRSLAIAVEEITAAVGTSAAGVRELTSAVATSTSATAVKVTQLESSLGNYYQDGTAGRAVLESTLTTQANFTTGLRAQYTLKVQAGGALAGFGIAATEINGTPSSAFIISADKFAIVAPNYSGGLTTTPDNNLVPFGVDADGIYMNTNVYVRGTMKVDTGGKTLANGLRGSLNLSVTASAWSDTTARQAVWTALGNAGSAVNNNHLVIGDTVTISNSASPPTYVQTKYWNNSAWTDSGVIINGNLLVDGSIAAGKIDARGLTIKDASGNIILNAGSSEFVGNVTGTVSGTAASTVVSNASTALSTANSASSAASSAQSTANSASSAASAAQSTANTANSTANSALSGLSNKISTDARSVLTGGGGIAVGSLTWNSSGIRTTGFGIGITSAGMAAYKSDGAGGATATFVLDGTNGNASFGGVLTAAAVDAVNTINIAGESVVTMDQFNHTIASNGGNNTGTSTFNYTFNMASAGNVSIQLVSVFFTNSPASDDSTTSFYLDGALIAGRQGTEILSATPKIIISKFYLSAGGHSIAIIHNYANIETANATLNITDIIVTKGYR